MAIKGKRLYQVYLDEEETEYIKSFLGSKRGEGGLSQLVNNWVLQFAATLKTMEQSGEGKINVAKLLKNSWRAGKRIDWEF